MSLDELATFDLETTGVNVETDRIVSAYIAVTNPKGILVEHEWLINPGIEIPAGATAVHGITTERAGTDGTDPGDALIQISAVLADITARGIPLVVYNAPFDLTLLDREVRRHGVSTGLWFELRRIVDPLVLDKAIDTYRKGLRRLANVVAHHAPNYPATEWHGAKADALAAAYVARLLLADYRLEGGTPDDWHKWQIVWARRQAESFAEYLTRKGEDASDVSPEWPMRAWRP